jgi:hypothetical protein
MHQNTGYQVSLLQGWARVTLFQTCLCFFVLFVCWARRSTLNHSLWKRWFVETSMIGYLAGTVINCPVLQSRCGLCVSFGVWPYVGTAAGVCSAHLNIHLKNIHRPWSFAGLSRKEVIFIVVSIDFVVSIDLACILILVSGWEWKKNQPPNVPTTFLSCTSCPCDLI